MRDDGVSEVIGFVLMFALSSMVLVISVQNFTDAKQSSEDVVAGVEMKAVASRVSTRLVQAGSIAQEWPEAWFNATLIVPDQVAGYDYSVTITDTEVLVRTMDRGIEAETTTFRLDAFTASDPSFKVYGTAYSTRGAVTVSYYPNATTGEHIIEIKEGTS